MGSWMSVRLLFVSLAHLSLFTAVAAPDLNRTLQTNTVLVSNTVVLTGSNTPMDRLLQKGRTFRLSTDGETAAREYQFTVTINCLQQEKCPFVPTVFHFVARPGDIAMIAETTNGLPYAFARNGFGVMLDSKQPGRFLIIDESNLKVQLRADKQIDFKIWQAAEEGMTPDIEFDLRSVLKYLIHDAKESYFEKATQEIDLTTSTGSKIRIQLPRDGHETKLGITGLTLQREVKIRFSDFVLENVPRANLLKLNVKDFAALQNDARKVGGSAMTKTSPMIPSGFLDDSEAQKAAERLKAILVRDSR